MASQQHTGAWQFVDDRGTFTLGDPHRTGQLYFPLVNESGMMASVSPTVGGDIKTGQNTFLTAPVSIEDLHNGRSTRNFWVHIDGYGPWSATRNSARQIVADDEQVTLTGGLLWHNIVRENRQIGVRAAITNLVPVAGHNVELMRVALMNTGSQPLTYNPTAAIPLYGRSADNLRDHRHVTSLLHRIETLPFGVLVRPTLTFDERGHRANAVAYGVFGVTAESALPSGFVPILEDFIGAGGNLAWPEVVVAPESVASLPAGHTLAGYEAIGALRFESVTLEPGETRAYILLFAVLDDSTDPQALLDAYGSDTKFAAALDACEDHWQRKASALTFHTADTTFDGWMRWVGVQPTLRRLFGNSFLPAHDYGSNATIIGAEPGEFVADRNNIPRVWMDHGAWPYLTVRLYIDQSGDIAFLLREQTYFKDPHDITNRAGNFSDYTDEDGNPIKADIGIVVVGERPYAEGQGDDPRLNLPRGDMSALRNMAEYCDKLVVILISGRPMIITGEIGDWDALLAAWLPGTEGQGVVDGLFGVTPITGKTSFEWPASIDQVPLGSSDEEPLFASGYGLETSAVEMTAETTPLVLADFEGEIGYTQDEHNNNIGFVPWGDAPDNVVLELVPAEGDLALPDQDDANTVLSASYDIAAFGGFTHVLTDGENWVAQDWSSYSALEFWLYGANSGGTIQVEIHDNRAAGSTSDTAERWFYHIVDDFEGWQHVSIPFADFQRRSDRQPGGAPDHGLGLTEVYGYAFGFPVGVGAQTTYLDDVSLSGGD